MQHRLQNIGKYTLIASSLANTFYLIQMKPFYLIIISGPPASGKMTVGQQIQKQTGIPLFHNHMSLELANAFFEWSTPNFRSLDKKIRFDIFTEVANSDLHGLIFSMVWAFDDARDEAYIDEIIKVFDNRNPRVCFVELVCDLEERLRRNKTENRLKHKASKRDIAASDRRLLGHEHEYRMNSIEGDLKNKTMFKIDNSGISAEQAAIKIIDHFGLTLGR